MSAPEVMDDEQAALMRLINPESSPITTPDMLIKFGMWMMAKVRQEIAARPAPVGQEWGTLGQVMQVFGKKKSATCEMLNRLREQGKVRVFVPPTGMSGKGDTLYNLRDIEAACMENALRVERGRA